MEIQIVSDADAAALEGAKLIAAEARTVVAARGHCCIALSGGRAPWQMLSILAGMGLPWQHIHWLQVDERVAPDGDPDRNLTHLRESLFSLAPIPPGQIHPMPVQEQDLDAAASSYAQALSRIAGDPPVLDLVHLGLGPDGHTASLVPGDPVLDVTNRDVAMTGVYQKRRRMTLTYPALNRARRILWLVSGAEKAEMLARLRAADASIPAGRVRQGNALLLTDVPIDRSSH